MARLQILWKGFSAAQYSTVCVTTAPVFVDELEGASNNIVV